MGTKMTKAQKRAKTVAAQKLARERHRRTRDNLERKRIECLNARIMEAVEEAVARAVKHSGLSDSGARFAISQFIALNMFMPDKSDTGTAYTDKCVDNGGGSDRIDNGASQKVASAFNKAAWGQAGGK